MKKLNEIKTAVNDLPKEDLKKFRKWFTDFESDFWDNKIEADLNSGKLDHLVNEAISEYSNGNFRL
jgi:hypothetical protein